ncbi:hypothetical protein EV401DRAFT_649575 [Pisolithus croceorrhizus]|nr:hypothetical protein EV401DRAFT_649575 [Pisolithus croceorrhizus]
MLTYSFVSATMVSMSNNLSFCFLEIANASSALGRLSQAGFLADRIGPLNVMISFTPVILPLLGRALRVKGINWYNGDL